MTDYSTLHRQGADSFAKSADPVDLAKRHVKRSRSLEELKMMMVPCQHKKDNYQTNPLHMESCYWDMQPALGMLLPVITSAFYCDRISAHHLQIRKAVP